MNTKMMLGALSFAVSALVSTTALADDGKVYTGSSCQGLNTASENLIYRFANYAENTSTTNSALVMCPIVKDVVAGTRLNYIRVSFTKNSSSGFYCAIYGRTATGGGSYSSSLWDFNGAGTRSFVLSDINGYSSGTYSLYCIIPPRGRIQSYRIDER